MDSKADRKEAIRKYKERKAPLGAFAISCTATGEVWVGSSRNLEAIRNRHWFALRNGLCTEKPLQEAWNTHGEEKIQYEILEKLDDDVSEFEVADLLKEKRRGWIAKLGARPL
jgi:hypothetical protein